MKMKFKQYIDESEQEFWDDVYSEGEQH